MMKIQEQVRYRNMGILEAAKSMSVDQNVTFNVLDSNTGKVVRSYSGHNQVTNSMLVGIAHFLMGDGVLNQGSAMLDRFVPKYISLGTLGLWSQEADADGLPIGIGVDKFYTEEKNFIEYMKQVPGYGADGYDRNQNNGRSYFGLGPKAILLNNVCVDCELISDTFPRSPIVYRELIPETRAEYPQTVDVVLSAMISTGALAQFRGAYDHIFITEAGLWSRPDYVYPGDNGLLAAYRLVPPNKENWDMTVAANRQILKQQIIRVDINQVVQVIWKIQLGSLIQLLGGDSNE